MTLAELISALQARKAIGSGDVQAVVRCLDEEYPIDAVRTEGGKLVIRVEVENHRVAYPCEIEGCYPCEVEGCTEHAVWHLPTGSNRPRLCNSHFDDELDGV